MTLESRHIEYLDDLFETGAGATVQNGRDCFNEWERDFLDDNYKRYEQYGSETRFSTKQCDILFRIGVHLGLDDPR